MRDNIIIITKQPIRAQCNVYRTGVDPAEMLGEGCWGAFQQIWCAR